MTELKCLVLYAGDRESSVPRTGSCLRLMTEVHRSTRDRDFTQIEHSGHDISSPVLRLYKSSDIRPTAATIAVARISGRCQDLAS